jgi:hypothetical protein
MSGFKRPEPVEGESDKDDSKATGERRMKHLMKKNKQSKTSDKKENKFDSKPTDDKKKIRMIQSPLVMKIRVKAKQRNRKTTMSSNSKRLGMSILKN